MILALDQSLTCSGIVIMSEKQEIFYSGSFSTKKGDTCYVTDSVARGKQLALHLNKLILEYSPTEIVVESISLGSVGNATRTLPMFLGAVLSQLPTNLDVFCVAPTQLKKFATGSGRADKKQMLEAIFSKNPFFHQELLEVPISKGKYDLADAFHLAIYHLETKHV